MNGNVIVVGGGAAGCFAAYKAAIEGCNVTLLEKNNILLKKIYITGKGRCNITNIGDIDNFMDNIPTNPYFLYSAFSQLSNTDTLDILSEYGVKTKVERGGRVFPVTDLAEDVVKAISCMVKHKNIRICLSETVESLILNAEGTAVTGVKASSQKFMGDAVIIATGGLSYPGTGSTGDGYRMAKEAALAVTKLYPSLVPLTVKENWCTQLQGLSLRNVGIVVQSANGKQGIGKKIYSDFGEMLFTHFGLSGPVILSASSRIPKSGGNFFLHIDLKPALDEDTLDKRLLRDFQKYINRDIKNALDDLLPQKIIPVVLQLAEVDEYTKVNSLTSNQRRSLLRTIKNITCTITGNTGFGNAVITSGGVHVNELNPSTMESKKVTGLYFVGEVIDCDGYTGGYNLQIAFSTGYTAGIAAAEALHAGKESNV